ncbi:LysM domain-containing protein [Diplocarpon rosae]|nr:LysM domain-containing protein [Diplocarpon rosae]
MIPSSSTISHPRSDANLDPDSNTNPISSSTIRPRNRRQIRTATDQELVSTSATSTPAGSRAVSPLPRENPSRSGSGTRSALGRSNPSKSNGRLLTPQIMGRSSGSLGAGLGGVWDGGWMGGWSTLQGIANSVMSAMEGGIDSDARPSRRGQGSTKGPSEWGPPSPGPKKKGEGIGMGSTEEREAALIQRKRAGVLEGRDEDRIKDMSGNYKRRTSGEEQRPGSEEDDQALVYIHHVQKQDTLQGVILRYNCNPDVFRKANRLWPNDSIQIRKTVVLPVDACTVKGRPSEPPDGDYSQQGIDLLASTPGNEDPQTSDKSPWSGLAKGKSAELPEESENPWVHVRWVLIDSSPTKPVEIARMPRKTLGYFPPRRRKSTVTTSTPRGSSDLPLLSNDFTANTSSPSTSSRRTSNLGPQPSQATSSGIGSATIGSYFPTHPSRPRRESVGEGADRLGWMRGPGGVGTFGKNVRRPGPGQDGLNSWARKHAPGLTIGDLPSTSILGGEVAHFGFGDELESIHESTRGGNGAGLVGTSASGPGAGQMGLENAAAAIEGWVRRIATITPGVGSPSGQGRPEPDLIELLDGTGSDDGRGFEVAPGRMRSTTPVGLGKGGKGD